MCTLAVRRCIGFVFGNCWVGNKCGRQCTPVKHNGNSAARATPAILAIAAGGAHECCKAGVTPFGNITAPPSFCGSCDDLSRCKLALCLLPMLVAAVRTTLNFEMRVSACSCMLSVRDVGVLRVSKAIGDLSTKSPLSTITLDCKRGALCC